MHGPINIKKKNAKCITPGLNYGIFGKVTSSAIPNIPVTESPHLMSCCVFTNIRDRYGTLLSKVPNITATSHQANIASSCLFALISVPFPRQQTSTLCLQCVHQPLCYNKCFAEIHQK